MSLKKTTSKPILKKILRGFVRTVLVLFVIFILLILFIRSPWGQDFIVGKVISYVSEKIDTKFEIGKLYLTFSGNLTLEELLLEDEAQDTLLYTQYLEADVPLMPLIFGDEIKVDLVDWKGLKANVNRKDSIPGYNFQFIMDAFASEDVENQNTEAQKPLQISMGMINFSDFDLTYNDELNGIDTQLKLGQFNLKSQKIDLEAMKFHFSEVHLKQTSLIYLQSKAFKSEDTEEESVLPQIIIDRLDIEKTNLNYTSIPDKMKSEITFEKFSFHKLSADLNDQDISLENLSLVDSQIALEMNSNAEKELDENENQTFSWPQWKVNVAEIELKNNKIEVSQNEKKPVSGQFSTEAIALTDFNFDAEHLKFSKNKRFSINLNNFQFKDKSGLELNQFAVNTQLNQNGISLNDIRLKVNNSLLFADLKLDYKTLEDFIKSPESAQFDFKVEDVQVDIADALLFLPELKQNPNFKALTKHKFTGDFSLAGNLEELQIPQFDLNWGDNTSLTLNGNLNQVTDVDSLGINLKNYAFKSSKIDIAEFIQEDSLGVSIPKTLVLEGQFQKNTDVFSTQSKLKIPEGIIDLEGNFSNTTTIEYALNLNVKSLKLGDILQNPEIGELSMSINSKGKGNSINELSAEFSSTIDSIRYADYTFSTMKLNGEIKKGQGNLKFDYDDDNLKFNLISKIHLDSLSSQIDTEIDLQGIRTQKLGLTKKDLRAKVLTKLQFKGNLDDFSLDAQFKNALVIYEGNQYNISDINFTSTINPTQTKADFSSRFLNFNLNANADVDNISKALKTHFKRHFDSDFTESETLSDSPVKLNFDLNFTETPILSEVFMEGIQEMDTLKSSLRFDEEKQSLTSNITLPYLNFNDIEIKGLQFKLDSNKNAFDINLGFENIKAEPLDIAQTEITGVFKNKRLDLNLKALRDEKAFFNSSISTTFEDDGLYRINLSSENLILNGKPWSISENNEIVYQNNAIQVSDFVLNRNAQEIKITDDLEVEKTHLGLVFKNFKLSSITNYFNPDKALANGDLEGDFVVIEPFSSQGLISNLQIDNLKITQILLGNLKLKAEATSDDNYNLDLSLKDAGIDFDLNGIYHTNVDESDIDLDLNLNKLNLGKIEDFAGDYIKDSGGNLYGELKVKGNLADLSYDGFLGFKQAQFNLKTLNTAFKFKDEKIDFSNDKMILNGFDIEDEKGNTITANGSATFEEITNPTFDLSFEAQNFQLLNSTAEDNDLYFGKLVFDVSALLTGDLDLPKLDVDLTIKDESDITYIVPTSQASIEERDGIVVFVNKKNPDNIMTQKEDDALNAKISGIELKSNIKIEKQSKVKVVIDKRTNDNVSVQGGGDFKFDMDKSGRMDLVGKYKVTSGSVELNLYNLVKRKFEISPTSSVTWSGNPYDADLDIRAIYNIKTSASALMASQTAGENLSFQNKYRQKLPFMIYMDINGELTSPELGFELDMPENKQGAIDGSVYGRIKQVNQEEDQLNKHVFSLLVLSKFYPEAGSDGSQGGGASIVSKKLNQVLSDQLNTFSDKLIGDTGISLNIDVNSYTDYQGNSVEDRTDVDVTAQKKFMDDRLVIEAGSTVNVQGSQRSNESQTGLSDVSVEYLLTEDGRWKLRGFRKSEYENVIDGQVFISGVALIFTREFNKFKELWSKAYRESLEKENAETENKTKESNQDKQ
ncbi:MAG: translocation/assembly module TamB domain-containing protein [Psychroflexus sp.]